MSLGEIWRIAKWCVVRVKEEELRQLKKKVDFRLVLGLLNLSRFGGGEGGLEGQGASGPENDFTNCQPCQ